MSACVDQMAEKWHAHPQQKVEMFFRTCIDYPYKNASLSVSVKFY